MSITIRLDLPEEVVEKARAAGLLESSSLSNLLSTELQRRKAATELDNVLDEIRSQPGEPMSMDEIQAEVDAVRSARRAREAGR
jgi:hypothetical protein